jgi:hypothetical protein
MAAPLFGDEWFDKNYAEHAEAYAQFQAAVTTARASTNKGINQVLVSLLFIFSLFIV